MGALQAGSCQPDAVGLVGTNTEAREICADRCGENKTHSSSSGRPRGKAQGAGNLPGTSAPRTPLAFGGIAAPSVGNAGEPARLLRSSQGCWDKHRTLLARTGRVATAAPAPPFTPVVINQKLVNVCFPLRGQPLKTPPNLTSTPHLGAPSCCWTSGCVNRRTQTWPSAVKCEMQEPPEEEMSQGSLHPEPVPQAAHTAWLTGNCSAGTKSALGTKFSPL